MADVQSAGSLSSLDGESYRQFQSNTMCQSKDDYPGYEHDSRNMHDETAESFEDFFQADKRSGPVTHPDWKEETENKTNDWNIFRQSNARQAGSPSVTLSDDSDEDLEPSRNFPNKGLTSSQYQSVSGAYTSGIVEEDSYRETDTLEDQSDLSGSAQVKARVSIDDWMKRESRGKDIGVNGEQSALSTVRSIDSNVTMEDYQGLEADNKGYAQSNNKGRTTFDAWQTKHKTLLTAGQEDDDGLRRQDIESVTHDDSNVKDTWRSHDDDDTDVNGFGEEVNEIPITPSQKVTKEGTTEVQFKGKAIQSSIDEFMGQGQISQPGPSLKDNNNLGQGSQSRSSFEAWRGNREDSSSGVGVTMETTRTDSSLDTDVLLQGYKENHTADVMSEYKLPRSDDVFVSKTVTQTYSKPQKSQSDVNRKYESYMNHHGAENSKNELKREFVKEMLTRAKDRQTHKEDLYGNSWNAQEDRESAARTSSESSKHYPRGVTLSKTFTKTSNYTPAGRKWDLSKYDELAYGPSNVFQNSRGSQKTSHLGSYGTSKKYFQSDFTTKNWKIHGRKGLDKHDKKQVVPVVSDLAEADKEVSVGASVIDESYYKGLLVSSPIPRFSDSDSDLTSPLQSPEILPTTNGGTKILKKNDFKSNTYIRPHSASDVHSRTKTSSFQSKANNAQQPAKKPHHPESVGLSVEGVKQDTGPRRPKSAIGRYRTHHNPSFVDETLFGNKQAEPSFEAPWGEPDKLGKKPLPYVAITSMEPHLDRKTVPAKNLSRPGSAKSRPVSASSKKRQTKELHNFQQPYVDETLFGGGIQTGSTNSAPGFKAPWNKEKEPKPHAFDATDYRAVNARQKRQEASENKKPVWK